ncbi:MAG: hypothetical protein KDD82_09730, partial [Planctomycetes bacterium]|nr:hypothetical protein [Planctomycetota bacterium]
LSWGAGGMILGLLLGVAVALGLSVSAEEPDLRRDPRYLRLEDHLLSDDWEGAEADARALILLHPGDPQLHCYLGDALLGQDDQEPAAARAYEAALALDPAHPRAHEGKILALLGNRDFAQAKLACERAIALYPEWGPLYRRLGNARGELEGFAAELEELEHALELDPRDWLAYRQRSTARLIAELDLDDAERDAHAAIEIVGEDEASLYDNLVEIARRRKDYQRALHLSALAQGAAFRDAQVEELMVRRVGVLLDMPDTPQHQWLQQAASEVAFLLEAFPKNGSTHAQHAALLIRLGKFNEAIQANERALELYGEKHPRSAKVVRQNNEVLRAELERRRALGDGQER